MNIDQINHEPVRLNFGGAFATVVLMIIFAMGMAMMLSNCSTAHPKDQVVTQPIDQCTAEEEATCSPGMLHNNCLCPHDPTFTGSRMGSLNDDKDLFNEEPASSPRAPRFE
jgi:hypothetical protein